MSVEDNPGERSSSDSDESGVVVLASLIINALDNVKRGKTKHYNELIHKLADPEINEIHLQRCLKALASCSYSLTKQYDTLVGTALNTRWAVCGNETVGVFVEFLRNLLSAQAYYVTACLRMIVKHFLPDVSNDLELSAALAQKFLNAHEALQAVVEVVPLAPLFLIPELVEIIPYIKKPKIFQVSYVDNLLEISKYLPSLRLKILELVIDHLIKIDVEIPKHELEHSKTSSEKEEQDDHTQFEVDMDMDNAVETTAESDNEDENQLESEMADKLDVLMEIIFSYICDTTHLNGELLLDVGSELFSDLLAVFENFILPTHAPGHVQFVMFLICSFDKIFANSFLDFCCKKIEEPRTPPILRQASASYVASFIARAKYVPVRTLQTCLDLIAHWIHCYIDRHDANCSVPDADKHGAFYSVCQALFYMFIYRHKQLLDLKEGLKFIRKLNLPRIVTSRMNPLKLCLPSVVKLFARITRDHEIVFCYTIIERNKRMLLPVASKTSSCSVSNQSFINQLDTFFPFDPYCLKRSCKFIKPTYQDWEGHEHEEDEEKKHSDTEDECEEYLEYSRSPDATVLGFSPVTAMCISRVFVSSSSIN